MCSASRLVGEPTGTWNSPKAINLYFLWSVERVAVLYNLPTIGKKEWYRWGAEILVANQKKDGNWEDGILTVHPPVNHVNPGTTVAQP